MKNFKLTLRWIVVLLAFLTYACVHDFDDPNRPMNEQLSSRTRYSLSVEANNAKTFFEEDVAPKLPLDGSKILLFPGFFSPNWETAISDRSELSETVEVTFEAQYRYKGRYAMLKKDGLIHNYHVSIWQKLVFVDNGDGYRVYLMSLLPTRAYFKANQRLDYQTQITWNNKSDFCGKIIISSLYTGSIIRIDDYENGNRTDGTSTITNAPESLSSRLELLNEMMENIYIIQLNNIFTRSDEYGNWIDDILVEGSRPEPNEPYDDYDYDYSRCPFCGHSSCGGACNDNGGGGRPGQGGDSGNNSNSNSHITVKAPNGNCVVGALAAAIQALTKCSSSSAISKATEALRAQGINTNPSGGILGDPGGISISGEEMLRTIQSLGFNICDTPNITHSWLSNHFSTGGYGIGHFDSTSTTVGHEVLIIGYNSNGTYTLYDTITGNTAKTTTGNIAALFFKK